MAQRKNEKKGKREGEKEKNKKGQDKKTKKRKFFTPSARQTLKNREKTIFSKRGQYDFDIIYLPIYL